MVTESDRLVAHFDEPLMPAVLLTTAFASLSGILLGYDTGVINGALSPVSNHFELTKSQQETFVGIMNIGAFLGCFVGGFSADFSGRRSSIGFGAFLFLLANAVMTFAYDYPMLIIGRFICGVAVGMTMVTEPLYVAETSPARLRGGLSTNVEVSFQVGMILGFVASWAFNSLADEISWRWMIGIGLAFPIISLIGVFCVIPESPRWLASQNRLPEAQAVLQKLLGPKEAQSALAKLVKSQTAQVAEDKELSWWKMFTSEQTRWLVFIGGGVAFFQQAQGIEAIVYYSNTILDEAGMSREGSLRATMVMGILKLIAILVSGCFVDSWGRRPLLLISSTGMLISIGTLGFAFWFAWSWQYKLVFMITFLVVFSIGVGPIMYMLNAEIYPKNCRSKGLIWAMCVGRIVSAAVSMTFLSLTGLLNFAGAFFFYAAVGAIAIVFIVLVVPETKGTHLEDQDHKQLGTYLQDQEEPREA